MDNYVHFVGNLTADPVLRGSTDKPRATFCIMVNEKRSDKEVSHPINVTAFGTLGTNLANSLKKGMRVIVDGRIDSYKKAVVLDGENKEITMLSVTADAVGPDCRWASAVVTKVRTANSGTYAARQADNAAAPAPAAAPAAAHAAHVSYAPPASASDNTEDF